MSDSEAPDIEALLPLVEAGNQSAARSLVEALWPQVIRIVRAHLPRRLQEEDLAQEVFLKMFARLGQYRRDVPLAHWVSRIAVTTCIDQLRAQRRRPEWRLADFGEEEARRIEGGHLDPHQVAQGEALAARELVARLLERLDEKDRLVISLMELEQKTVAEVRALTGWNESMIKVRAFRARAKLRKLVTELETSSPRHR